MGRAPQRRVPTSLGGGYSTLRDLARQLIHPHEAHVRPQTLHQPRHHTAQLCQGENLLDDTNCLDAI